MFSRRNRFSFKKRIPRKTINTPYFVVRYDNNEELGLKVAVVVGKKVDKKAVVRNRIKRLMVRTIKTLLRNDQNLNMIFYARKPINDITSGSMKVEMTKVFQKII